jgi:hypothetical protein
MPIVATHDLVAVPPALLLLPLPQPAATSAPSAVAAMIALLPYFLLSGYCDA